MLDFLRIHILYPLGLHYAVILQKRRSSPDEPEQCLKQLESCELTEVYLDIFLRLIQLYLL